MSSRYSRRGFLARLGAATVGLALAPHAFGAEGKAERLNILLITADDMNWDSLGVTGCKIPGITPNIDGLAKQGIRFEHAHVTSAICQPSRSVLMTGRYPHRNGALGFQPINKDVPTLQESLHAAGYLNGILGKVIHLTPKPKFCWDMAIDAQDLKQGRDPSLFYQRCKEFFDLAKAEGKPFFLMANSQDPHRPFPGAEGPRKDLFPGTSRTYKPEEVPVPGFLPQEVPGVRKEMAQYFAGVHRCDETVGQVLRALKDSGMEENTVVFFLSDNGISQPFAKTCCYENSTRTPLIVRWPGKIKPGSVDREHFVSGIDFMPTVLEAAGLKQVDGMDGHSYLPILKGGKQAGRDRVFTFITETSGKLRFPMRSVRDRHYGYIYNAWSDGKTIFKNEPQGGLACKAMKEAAVKDEKLAERMRLFLYRVPEELYDLQSDPNELRNLADDPKHKATLEKMRVEMLEMMTSTKDPLLEGFRKRIGK